MFEVICSARASASREAVWELLADFERHGRWRDELVAMTHLSGPVGEVGARYEEVIEVGPKRVRSSIRVTAVEAPSRLVFIVEEPSRFPSTNEIVLEACDGTVITFRSRNRTTGPVALLDPLWEILFRRSLDRELENLCRVAERSTR